MLAERRVLIDTYAPQLQISDNATKIRAFLRDNQSVLPVDEILETLTKLGASPSVIYDDNGHFTIGRDGWQICQPLRKGGRVNQPHLWVVGT